MGREILILDPSFIELAKDNICHKDLPLTALGRLFM